MTSLPEEVEAEVEVLKFTYEDILSWKDDDPESRCMFLELRPRTGMAAAHQFLQVTVQVDFSQADQSDQIEDAVSFRITRLRGFEDDSQERRLEELMKTTVKAEKSLLRAVEAVVDEVTEMNEHLQGSCAICMGSLIDTDSSPSASLEVTGQEEEAGGGSEVMTRLFRLSCFHTLHRRCLERWWFPEESAGQKWASAVVKQAAEERGELAPYPPSPEDEGGDVEGHPGQAKPCCPTCRGTAAPTEIAGVLPPALVSRYPEACALLTGIQPPEGGHCAAVAGEGGGKGAEKTQGKGEQKGEKASPPRGLPQLAESQSGGKSKGGLGRSSADLPQSSCSSSSSSSSSGAVATLLLTGVLSEEPSSGSDKKGGSSRGTAEEWFREFIKAEKGDALRERLATEFGAVGTVPFSSSRRPRLHVNFPDHAKALQAQLALSGTVIDEEDVQTPAGGTSRQLLLHITPKEQSSE